MTTTNINYQQIYEEEITSFVRDSIELPDRFFEMSHQHRMLVEELVDAGYRRAIDDALNSEVLEEVAAMAGEMGTQLYGFANLVQSYLSHQKPSDEV
jgi:hypothetical protein